jgi:predicted nucleotide-binding protein
MLLLTKLNILHASARKILEPPESYQISGYLAESAEIIRLIREQRSVANIVFFLEMLSKEFRYSSDVMKEMVPEPSRTTQSGVHHRPGKIRVFVASSSAAQAAAEEVAMGLPLTSLGPDVTQSWLRLPDLGTQAMVGVRQAIKQCQYGVLVLTPEETTVPHDAKDAARPDTLHLRLSPDAEFMLGLMVGALGVENTFIVVPEDKKDQAELTSLLAGITLATYDPDQVGNESGNAMEMTCTKIAQTISKREGKT